MSTESPAELLDDASIDDPWERLSHTEHIPAFIADERDLTQLTQYRRLIESLEQRLKEETR